MVKFEVELDKNNVHEMLAAAEFLNKLAQTAKNAAPENGKTAMFVPKGLGKAEPAKEAKAEPAKEPKAETAKEPKAETAKEPKAETAKEPKAETPKEPKAETAKEPKAETAKEPKAETAKAEENPLAKVKALVKAKKDDHRQEIRDILESVGAKTIPTIPKDKITLVIEKLEDL